MGHPRGQREEAGDIGQLSASVGARGSGKEKLRESAAATTSLSTLFLTFSKPYGTKRKDINHKLPQGKETLSPA